ncbi:hypothetical protein D3C87_1809990 [compost metagenome]
MFQFLESEKRNSVPLTQVPTLFLIALDRIKEGLEISIAKTIVPLTLNQFKKDRTKSILGKNLQQVPVLIAIYQNRVLF